MKGKGNKHRQADCRVGQRRKSYKNNHEITLEILGASLRHLKRHSCPWRDDLPRGRGGPN